MSMKVSVKMPILLLCLIAILSPADLSAQTKNPVERLEGVKSKFNIKTGAYDLQEGSSKSCQDGLVFWYGEGKELILRVGEKIVFHHFGIGPVTTRSDATCKEETQTTFSDSRVTQVTTETCKNHQSFKRTETLERQAENLVYSSIVEETIEGDRKTTSIRCGFQKRD